MPAICNHIHEIHSTTCTVYILNSKIEERRIFTESSGMEDISNGTLNPFSQLLASSLLLLQPKSSDASNLSCSLTTSLRSDCFNILSAIQT